jgi:Fic family protein
MIMHGLLLTKKVGGEYRKVSIGAKGSQVSRPNHADVPTLMAKWFEETLVRQEGEHLFEFLVRIHSQFQYVHLFLNGNGRIGRIVMNLFLVKHGYPVQFFRLR